MTHREMQKRREGDERGRGRSDVSTSQGHQWLPEATRSQKRPGKGLPLEPSEGVRP